MERKNPIFQQQKLWHALEKEEVCHQLNTSLSGLEEKEAQKRLQEFGPNLLRQAHEETLLRILWRQLHNPIVYVLLFSTAMALLLGKIADSLVVFTVVVLNTIIGFIQEYRAHTTLKALTSLIPHKTMVLRAGHTKSIHSSHIVPGDVVVLEAGDRVSADLRLFSIKNLQCDESTLTGESLPVDKRIEKLSAEVPVADQKCMAFNGTYITAGVGLGIVVATGLETEFGKISTLIEHVTPLETPMTGTIKKIARGITWGILIVSFALFLIGRLRGSSLFDAGLAAIALTVAAIPEGLPAIITITSAIGVRRMARKQAIIRQLPAVEALGSTSVICTDKTGTLTCNEMTVQKLWTPSGSSFVSGIGYNLEGTFSSESADQKEIFELLKAAILCNEASLNETRGGIAPIGDPTEIALIVCGRKRGLLENELREEWTRKDIIPFTSEKKIMATLNASTAEQYIFVKGAPEEILAICSDINSCLIEEQVLVMAKEGLRVLAVARKKVESSLSLIDETNIKTGFTLLGLTGMIDPPREEVYKALQACREAGVTVKMVTGDHPITAEAIGRHLGILQETKVVTGMDLAKFNAAEWKRAVKEAHVFARVSPEHKLRLVEVLQELGHVVAMTGDGVNDAPALKRADIGIAMGIKGTAVAKEASDMVLADDNFASIQTAVEEGRRVYDNLIKSLAFILPTSLGQSLVVLFVVLFFPFHEGILLQPMSPVQILWVNLVVAVALSLPLAFESAEPDIMKRPPRKKNASILNSFLLIKTLLVAVVMAMGTIGLFLWEYKAEIRKGTAPEMALSEAQTIAVTALILFQVFYLFNCRSFRFSSTHFFSNPTIFIGVGAVLLAQAAFIYLPFMNYLFKSSNLDTEELLFSTLITFLIVPVILFENFIRKKFQKFHHHYSTTKPL